MYRFAFLFIAFMFTFLFAVAESSAMSGQFGDTGLISQPKAQTLNEGNICVGLWANCFSGENGGDPLTGGTQLILPATITIGLGTFIESYGSFPNLLFNGDEMVSGRGYANAGFKLRVLGKRSDPFRMAVDLQGRRSISDDPDFDGMTDYVGRVIASMRKENSLAIHLNAGYAINDSPAGMAYDDQVLLGAGVEYSLATRLRLMAEFSTETEKVPGAAEVSEATVGFQYFLTPHLTMNLAGSVGLTEASPDWRVILGMTTCQGVGTYNRPVPKLVDPDEVVDVPLEPVKASKIKALTPLLSKIPVAQSPVSHLEIPIDGPGGAIFIDPSDRLRTPAIKAWGQSPVAPMGAAAAEEGEVKLPEKPFAAVIKRHFRFPELAFSFNQWELSEQGRESISLVAEELRKEKKFFVVSIEGHTDDVGSDAYNQTLSFKRAVAAATHLVLRNGFDPARIFVKGHGESKPIAVNDTDEGRAKNRRVELLILVPQGYEDIDLEVIESPEEAGVIEGKSAKVTKPIIDPLAIEQAIMDKTGAETATPAGAFSQVDTVEESDE